MFREVPDAFRELRGPLLPGAQEIRAIFSIDSFFSCVVLLKPLFPDPLK
jgi:hypothetical protein